MAYSLFLLNDGRIGSRQEREFLLRERTQVQYEKLASTIKTFAYHVSGGPAEDDTTELDPVFDGKSASQKYLPNINGDDDLETQKEPLFGRSESFVSTSSELSNKTDKLVKAKNTIWDDEAEQELVCSSVAKRIGSDGKIELVFKYKSCSICLCDFEHAEKVKVIPRCGHTFHEDCLEGWLQKRFRCPNCNTDIVPDA